MKYYVLYIQIKNSYLRTIQTFKTAYTCNLCIIHALPSTLDLYQPIYLYISIGFLIKNIDCKNATILTIHYYTSKNISKLLSNLQSHKLNISYILLL